MPSTVTAMAGNRNAGSQPGNTASSPAASNGTSGCWSM